MYKKRFFSQFNEPFLDFEGERRMAVRRKGFSCHLLSRIRSKRPIYDTDVISELHVRCPIPFFLFDLFPKLLFSYPPNFLTCCWPLSFSGATNVFPCACCLHFQPHTDCISPHKFYGAIDGGGFQENAYHSFLGFCQDGFKCPCSNQRLIQNLMLSR